LRSSNWLVLFLFCAIAGVVSGYFITLLYKPSLIPPVLRIGGLTSPTTVLFLGTDVVYTKGRRNLKADQASFQGRSDTVMVVRLDPFRNTVSMLQIPRDTTVRIPGHGRQKINGANAIGGPHLAAQTIWSFLGVPIDHYVVLNVHGLVELVDELGGLTVDVPKRMRYTDHSAKLNIDLTPGPHLLNGTQAMGFVRYRHDALGDIGRVQRQEIFLKAVQDKALDPATWTKLPKLISIAQNYVLTDLSTTQLMQLAQFARAVPKDHQTMIMLPGTFSGSGDWAVDEAEAQVVVNRLMGHAVPASANKQSIRIAVENASSNRDAGRRLYKYLLARGYNVVSYKEKSDVCASPMKTTRIIAQKGNTEDAMMVKGDLRNQGDVINASIGDIQCAVTVIAGDDFETLSAAAVDPSQSPKPNHRRHHRHSR
jgi:polyisoprenyl-teichoic acid--peptidoglycan teichoic acid transferase